MQRSQTGGSECESCGSPSDALRVTNVLAAARMLTKIDMHKLVKKQPNTVLNPQKMNCVILRHRSVACGRAVALIFASGYVSVNGCRTPHEARRSVRQFARIVQKSGAVAPAYDGRISSIHIQAISATCKLPKNLAVDMRQLVDCTGALYEPEIFTAATLRRQGVCFLVFKSGSVVITGMKDDPASATLVRHVINCIGEECCIKKTHIHTHTHTHRRRTTPL